MESEIITIIFWVGLITGSVITSLLRLITKKITESVKRKQEIKETFFAAHGKQAITALKNWENKE